MAHSKQAPGVTATLALGHNRLPNYMPHPNRTHHQSRQPPLQNAHTFTYTRLVNRPCRPCWLPTAAGG
jgi:hypothetical protein